METSRSATVSTKQERIAELARTCPEMAITTLHHHIDLEWMTEAWNLTRKDGATGIDGVAAADYEVEFEANPMDRIEPGRYHAPPVRRHYIPMLMAPAYEQDFLPCSYGFRLGQSAHKALADLRHGLAEEGRGWVIDADISKYFDSIDHKHLRTFLGQRIKDGVVRRMIDKWLAATALDEGTLRRPEAGTPQGGRCSSLFRFKTCEAASLPRSTTLRHP